MTEQVQSDPDFRFKKKIIINACFSVLYHPSKFVHAVVNHPVFMYEKPFHAIVTITGRQEFCIYVFQNQVKNLQSNGFFENSEHEHNKITLCIYVFISINRNTNIYITSKNLTKC